MEERRRWMGSIPTMTAIEDENVAAASVVEEEEEMEEDEVAGFMESDSCSEGEDQGEKRHKDGFLGERPLSDFELEPVLKENLERAGIETFFPVQSASFEIMMGGRDIIGKSKTGSGKTLAFALPIVQKMMSSDDQVHRRERLRALIMLPTRELAIQVADEFKRIAPQLHISSLVGGMNIANQIQDIKQGIDVAVGTPGRISDLLNRKVLDLEHVKTVVLDEADMMLKIGFKDEVEEIFSYIPKNRQSVMWTATFPPWVNSIAKTHLRNAYEIDLVGDDSMKIPSTVDHSAIYIHESSRQTALKQYMQANMGGDGQTLIFTQTKKEVDELAHIPELRHASPLHGDLSQSQRNGVIQGFRNGRVKTIVCTDIAARGLDIANVDLVIHYRLPTERESFVHRTGRTGRAGRLGSNLVLFDENERQELFKIKKEYGIEIKQVSVPDGAEYMEKSLAKIERKILNSTPPVGASSKTFDASAQRLFDLKGISALSSALGMMNGADRLHDFSLLTGQKSKVTLQFNKMDVSTVLDTVRKWTSDHATSISRSSILSHAGKYLVDVPSSIYYKLKESGELESTENFERVTSLNELVGGSRRSSNHRSSSFGKNEFGHFHGKKNHRARWNRFQERGGRHRHQRNHHGWGSEGHEGMKQHRSSYYGENNKKEYRKWNKPRRGSRQKHYMDDEWQ